MPLQEAELVGAPDGLVTDTGRGRVVVKKGWTCRRVGLRAGTKCFTGKAFFPSGQRGRPTAPKYLGSRRQGRKGWQDKVSPAKSCSNFLQGESRQAQGWTQVLLIIR